MEILLKLLVLATFIVGHAFLFIVVGSTDFKDEKRSNLWGILAGIYISYLVLIFLAWILSGRYGDIRNFFLFGLNITYVISAIFASMASNVYLNNVEQRLNTKRYNLNYILRIIIINYGAFSIASAQAVTKSTLYITSVTDYKFGGKIEEVLDKKTQNLVLNKTEEQRKLNLFLNDVNRLQDDSIRVKGSLFSFLSGNYDLVIPKEYDFELEYDYTYSSSRNGGISVHNIVYLPRIEEDETFVNISLIDSRKSFITKDELIQSINKQLIEFDSIKKDQLNKPANLLEFAYSSLMDSLGFKDYDFKPVDEKSEKADSILRWLFWVLTTIVIFEFTRRWTSSELT